MIAESLPHWCHPKLILVATNLKDELALLSHAAAEARLSGATLLLAHVADSDRLAGDSPRVLSMPSTHEATNWLKETARQLRNQGIACEYAVRVGSAVGQICALAQARAVDRVIVSSGRNEGSQSAFALALAARLRTPIWVVSRQVRPHRIGKRNGGRIILPVSLHTDRPSLWEFATELAKARCARLALLHVIQTAQMDDVARRNALIRARMQVAAVSAGERHAADPPDIVIREGEPALQIIEEAGATGCDVLVLSSPQPLAHLGENTFADCVISNSRCPVAVLHNQVHSDSSELHYPAQLQTEAR